MSYRVGATKPRVSIPTAFQYGAEPKRKIIKKFKTLKKAFGGRHLFLTSAIIHLRFEHDAEIVGFDFDQWFSVFVEDETNEYYCECDIIEHGIAAIIWFLDEAKKARKQ